MNREERNREREKIGAKLEYLSGKGTLGLQEVLDISQLGSRLLSLGIEALSERVTSLEADVARLKGNRDETAVEEDNRDGDGDRGEGPVPGE